MTVTLQSLEASRPYLPLARANGPLSAAGDYERWSWLLRDSPRLASAYHRSGMLGCVSLLTHWALGWPSAWLWSWLHSFM